MINEDNKEYFATKNIGHCFSRKMTFEDWKKGLDPKKLQKMNILDLNIYRFLDEHEKNSIPDNFTIDGYPINCSLVIKHLNKGKIESHLWFFKGFCQYLDPEFVQIIDAGTIPLHNSVSHIVLHMEKFENIAGACGEIEVLIPDKKDNGDMFSFFEKAIMEA